jgi:hypothetical protein
MGWMKKFFAAIHMLTCFSSIAYTRCSYLPRFILGLNDVILSVIDDVPVDSETPLLTLSILRFIGPSQFFRDAHRSRVCVHALIG